MQNNTQIDHRCQLTNTWLHIQFDADISAELGNTIPYPNHHYIRNNKLVYCWLISGWFDTANAVTFLNDIIARFKITYIDCKYLKHSKDTQSSIKPYILKEFQGLKSKAKSILKDKYSRVETKSDDYVFWCIKLYCEDLIRQNGLIIYSSLESWAFDNFIDHCKDKSTLRAKCRGTYNWYFERDWKIGRVKVNKTSEEIMATRVEHANKLSLRNEEIAKQKIYNAQRLIKYFGNQDGKLSLRAVERESGCSINTVRKHYISWDKI